MEGNDPESASDWLSDHYLGKQEVKLFEGETDALVNHYIESEMYPESELPEWAREQYEAMLKEKAQSDINGGVYYTEYESQGVYHIFTH
jgi:hypothetical protein